MTTPEIALILAPSAALFVLLLIGFVVDHVKDVRHRDRMAREKFEAEMIDDCDVDRWPTHDGDGNAY